ncbi:hypothetical protein V8F06_012598 [Rhypophila decipiens]
MSSTDLTAALNFLTDAGHLLATTAPEISSFLMNKRGNLLFENEVPPSDIQRQHVCSCCGHIMVPGNGSTLKIDHKRSLDKKARSAKAHKQKRTRCSNPYGPTKVFSCGHCDKFTMINLPAPAPVSRRKIKKEERPAASTQAQTLQDTTPLPKGTANANSKKRAKSRKAGLLQALLDQKNASQSSRPGLGLSFADFEKK